MHGLRELTTLRGKKCSSNGCTSIASTLAAPAPALPALLVPAVQAPALYPLRAHADPPLLQPPLLQPPLPSVAAAVPPAAVQMVVLVLLAATLAVQARACCRLLAHAGLLPLRSQSPHLRLLQLPPFRRPQQTPRLAEGEAAASLGSLVRGTATAEAAAGRATSTKAANCCLKDGRLVRIACLLLGVYAASHLA